MICCQKLRINGVLTHEHGCTEAWRTGVKECKWCGSTFNPEGRHQMFCEQSCAEAYTGTNYED